MTMTLAFFFEGPAAVLNWLYGATGSYFVAISLTAVIVMAIVTEMAVITPPVGLNLFVIQGISPGQTSLMTVAKGSFPFFLILVLAVILFTIFPELVLWLPFG